MLPNDYVYKGYRLTAKVSRAATTQAGEPSSPTFTALVSVVQVSSVQDDGYIYTVPYFVAGGVTYSPAEAINVAITHGRDIVAALTDEVAA